ncbi:RNA-binding domain-containing protein [Ceratobasidium sp. AG-I]|nr:RNA-binding domain-containing protein [Ceratobasidium sp. AG-I]
MAQPNKTLYIKNLNDQIKKEELKSQLYALFSPYGRILDVVAMKRPQMRGQAFVVFHDLAGATAAMRAWDGEVFYDKEMRIEYAKSRSHATRKVEEPGWDPLTEAKAKALGLGSRLGANGAGGNKGRITTSSNAEAMEIEREKDQSGSKRDREDETTSPTTGRTAKRGRGQEDGEEMDMDDDQEATPSNVAA